VHRYCKAFLKAIVECEHSKLIIWKRRQN